MNYYIERHDMEHIEVVETNGEQFDIYFEPQDKYYEVYDSLGNCLNEGNLFFEKPTIKEIKKLHSLFFFTLLFERLRLSRRWKNE